MSRTHQTSEATVLEDEGYDHYKNIVLNVRTLLNEIDDLLCHGLVSSSVHLWLQLDLYSKQIEMHKKEFLEIEYLSECPLEYRIETLEELINRTKRRLRQVAKKSEENDCPTRKGENLMKFISVFIYGSLTISGICALGLAAFSYYLTPLFDPNIARVLMPMSLAFLSMVGLDYILREHRNG